MADIYLGSTDLSSATFYLGSDAVSALYQGSTELWTSGPAYVTDGLLQYIDPFASTIGGGTVSDLSGNGNDATLVNSIAVVGSGGGGDSGWQLNVTGGSAKALNLGLNNTDFNTNGGTLEIWWKVDTASYDSEPGILYQYRTSPDRQFGIGMKAQATPRIYTQNQGSTTASDIDVAGNYADATWRQLVLVLNAGGAGFTFYFNAVSVGTSATNIGSVNADAPFYAGGRIGNFVRGYADAWMGLTRIYTKALTSSEVTQNYNANKADYGL